MSTLSPERIAGLDQLSTAADARIGCLRPEILRKANGTLPSDDIAPNGVYEELASPNLRSIVAAIHAADPFFLGRNSWQRLS